MSAAPVSTRPTPAGADGLGEIRAIASVPLPPLRSIPDFVGMPTGDQSLADDSTFLAAQGAALGWLVLCVIVCLVVGGGVAARLSWPYAVALFALFVWIPAYLSAFRYVALLLDDPPGLTVVRPTTPVTVVLSGSAAPMSTLSTLSYLAHQDYDGPVRVVLVGGALADEDVVAVQQAARQYHLDLHVLRAGWLGPAEACNLALPHVDTPLLLQLHPGACAHPSALRLLAARLESGPADTAAVSGRAFVRNRRDGTGAEILAVDYALEIAATQQVESRFHGAGVAGATCTMYRVQALRAVNGLPPVAASDVAVAECFLERGWRVTHEPRAIAFTTEPVTLGTVGRSRGRASRGVSDAVRANGGFDRERPASGRFLAALARSGPVRDAAFVVATAHAVVLLFLGNVALLAGYLILVVPVALAASGLARRSQREVLDEAGLVAPRRLVDAISPVRSLSIIQAPPALAEALRGWPARDRPPRRRVKPRRLLAGRGPRYA